MIPYALLLVLLVVLAESLSTPLTGPRFFSVPPLVVLLVGGAAYLWFFWENLCSL